MDDPLADLPQIEQLDAGGIRLGLQDFPLLTPDLARCRRRVGGLETR